MRTGFKKEASGIRQISAPSTWGLRIYLDGYGDGAWRDEFVSSLGVESKITVLSSPSSSRADIHLPSWGQAQCRWETAAMDDADACVFWLGEKFEPVEAHRISLEIGYMLGICKKCFIGSYEQHILLQDLTNRLKYATPNHSIASSVKRLALYVTAWADEELAYKFSLQGGGRIDAH